MARWCDFVMWMSHAYTHIRLYIYTYHIHIYSICTHRSLDIYTWTHKHVYMYTYHRYAHTWTSVARHIHAIAVHMFPGITPDGIPSSIGHGRAQSYCHRHAPNSVPSFGCRRTTNKTTQTRLANQDSFASAWAMETLSGSASRLRCGHRWVFLQSLSPGRAGTTLPEKGCL